MTEVKETAVVETEVLETEEVEEEVSFTQEDFFLSNNSPRRLADKIEKVLLQKGVEETGAQMARNLTFFAVGILNQTYGKVATLTHLRNLFLNPSEEGEKILYDYEDVPLNSLFERQKRNKHIEDLRRYQDGRAQSYAHTSEFRTLLKELVEEFA